MVTLLPGVDTPGPVYPKVHACVSVSIHALNVHTGRYTYTHPLYLHEYTYGDPLSLHSSTYTRVTRVHTNTRGSIRVRPGRLRNP